jgi:hypothetical protein
MVNRLGHWNGRHAEVFGLEREGEAHARVGEVAPQIAVDVACGRIWGRRPAWRRGHPPSLIEGLLQNRGGTPSLPAVVGQETGHVDGVRRRDAGDLSRKRLALWRGSDAAAALEDQVVLGDRADQSTWSSSFSPQASKISSSTRG